LVQMHYIQKDKRRWALKSTTSSASLLKVSEKSKYLKLLYSDKEISELFGIHRSTAGRLMQRSGFNPIFLAKKIKRWKAEDVGRLIDILNNPSHPQDKF